METAKGTVAGPLAVSVVSVVVDGSPREVLPVERIAGEVNRVTPTEAERGVAAAETVAGAQGGPVSNLGLGSGGVVLPGAVE